MNKLVPFTVAGLIAYLAWDWYKAYRVVDVASGGNDQELDNQDTEETITPTRDTDIEGLARMLASEAPASHYSEAERTAILWCASNVARKRKWTLTKLLLPAHHQKGHWCSTYQSPSPADTELATAFINGKLGSDATNGATSFFEPAEQDKELKQGVGGVTKSAAEIRKSWTNDGLNLTASIGRWEFYGKVA